MLGVRRKEFQVLQSVICLVAILVMHDLTTLERTTNRLRYD